MRNRGDTAVMIACGMALLVAVNSGRAQGLADPTRPPPTIEKPPAEAAGGDGTAAAGAGLQTIIRRAGKKPAAVINGEYVVLGGRVGDARLVKISDDSVQLRSSTGRETLKLSPGVEKTPAVKSGGGGSGEKKAGEKARK